MAAPITLNILIYFIALKWSLGKFRKSQEASAFNFDLEGATSIIRDYQISSQQVKWGIYYVSCPKQRLPQLGKWEVDIYSDKNNTNIILNTILSSCWMLVNIIECTSSECIGRRQAFTDFKYTE